MSLIPNSKLGRWAFAGIGSLGLLLAACGGTPAATGKVPKQITLVGDVASNPTWWFSVTPVSFNSTSNFATSYMYQGLLWISKTDTINYSRSIASSITPSKNDTVYTIQLNPKWKWSNGHPVTAADCVYAWDLAHWSAAKGAPWVDSNVGSHSFDEITSAVATGTHTLVVTVAAPISPLYVELASLGYLSPVPKFAVDKYSNHNQELSYLEKIGVNPSNPLFKIVDGPYVISKVVKNDYFIMKANPNYAGHKAAIKTIVFQDEATSASQFAATKTGLFAQTVPGNAYYTAGKQIKAYQQKPVPYNYGFQMIEPNYSSKAPVIGGLFNKLYFRQAMQMGIDQTAIVKALYQGYAYPVYDPVPEQPPNVFFDKNLKNPYPFNPAAGKKLLEKNGWTLQNGVMTKNGVKLAFDFLVASGSTTQTNIAQLLKQDWAQEGIDVTIRQEPFSQVIANGTSDPSKWVLLSWGGGWSYVPDYYPSGDGLFNPGGGANFGGYSSSQMNHLIQVTTVESGTAAQIHQRFDAYQVYSAQQLPVLYMPLAPTFYAVATYVKGFYSNYSAYLGTPPNEMRIGS